MSEEPEVTVCSGCSRAIYVTDIDDKGLCPDCRTMVPEKTAPEKSAPHGPK